MALVNDLLDRDHEKTPVGSALDTAAVARSAVTLRKGVRKQPAPRAAGTVPSGDIIVSNHVSYVEILYLAYKYQPTFTHVTADGLVRPVSLWEALKSLGDVGQLAATKDFVPVANLAKEARSKGWGPVVVFPEGTTSNGRGLLKFLPVFDTWTLEKSAPKIHLVGFRYDYDEFAPSVTVGNTLSHLFWMLAQFGNHLEVKYLPSDEVTLVSGEESYTSQLGALLGQVLRVRRTGLGAYDKVDFLEYYRARESKVGGTPRKKA
ncbi:hypothetical protein HDV00_000125 [Rhizophlyctis rosea]|nr:hypothetical protein HDV00_000125 [Rhizophlyctis rosea]